jgi:hypothetical protein
MITKINTTLSELHKDWVYLGIGFI